MKLGTSETTRNLKDMRDQLSTLARLEKELMDIRDNITKTHNNINRLKNRYEESVAKVKDLERGSFSTMLLRLTGQYYKRLDKADEKIESYKKEYDRKNEKIEDLYKKRDELDAKVSKLRDIERNYDAEIRKREESLLNSNSQLALRFRQLEKDRKKAINRSRELDRTITAVRGIKRTISSAMKSLESAHSWATYDVWTKNSIFGHIAKYDHIDSAQTDLDKIKSQLKGLKSQLANNNLSKMASFTEIDSTTRAVDFWLDNIFTDLNVRSKIRENQDTLKILEHSIDGFISRLGEEKNQIKRDIRKLEYEKEELVINV